MDPYVLLTHLSPTHARAEARKVAAGIDGQVLGEVLSYSLYLLSWCKSTKTDADAITGTQFACVTGTTVQTLY